MRAYLVDDEPLALSRLSRLLEERGDIAIAGCATSPAQAVSEIRRLHPDVLFLDIEMPAMSAFDLLLQLGTPHPPVIFTTAHDRYALEAFEVDSIAYLLKPIEAPALGMALGKLERLSGGSARRDLTALFERMRTWAAPQGMEFPARLASRVGEKVEFVEVSDITYFYAKDKLTFAVTRAKHHALDLSISDLERRLPPGAWVRIHRSALVCVSAVKELHTWFGGRLRVRLKDGTDLTVARERGAHVRARLGL